MENACVRWKRGSVLCLPLFWLRVASVLFCSGVDLRGCFSCSTFKENDHLQSLHAHTHKHTHKHNHIEPSGPVDLWKLLCSSDETDAHGSSCDGPPAGGNNSEELNDWYWMREMHKGYLHFWQAFVKAEVCLKFFFFPMIKTLLDQFYAGWLPSACKHRTQCA